VGDFTILKRDAMEGLAEKLIVEKDLKMVMELSYIFVTDRGNSKYKGQRVTKE
jgi:hypothetical protein